MFLGESFFEGMKGVFFKGAASGIGTREWSHLISKRNGSLFRLRKYKLFFD
jgi:hypothetical protein